MKNKRILFICQNIIKFKEKLKTVFMFIKNKGYEIYLACDEEVDMPFTEKNYVIGYAENQGFTSLIKVSNNLYCVMQNLKFDAIHTLDLLSSKILFLAEKKVKHNYAKTFLYLESVKKNRLISKRIARNADSVIVNNEEDYEYLKCKNYNQSVSLIYDLSIDFRKFNNVNFSETKNALREKYNLDNTKKYVSFIEAEESIDYVLEVITKISFQDSNICFLIKGEKDKRLKKLQKYGNLYNVIYLEDIKWLDLLFLSDSAIFSNIRPYDMTVFIYALMIGLPVIVPNTEFLNGYVKELVNGFFCHNKNVQQTILAIGRSTNMPKIKLDNLVKYNYEIINKFSSEKYTYSMSNLYSENIASKRKDIYVIESLKKKENAEILIGDMQQGSPRDSVIITIEKSKNDEKIEKLGAIVETLPLNSINDRIKFRKYFWRLFETEEYSSISVYGSMNKILRKNDAIIDKENIITRYDTM